MVIDVKISLYQGLVASSRHIFPRLGVVSSSLSAGGEIYIPSGEFGGGGGVAAYNIIGS